MNIHAINLNLKNLFEKIEAEFAELDPREQVDFSASINKRLKQLTEINAELKELVSDGLADGDSLDGDLFAVRCRLQARTYFDQTGFKADHPEIAKRYTTVREVRMITFGQI